MKELLLIVVLGAALSNSEAKMMAKGLGKVTGTVSCHWGGCLRPWDRAWVYEQSPEEREELELEEKEKKLRRNRHRVKEPCIGVCLHKKMLARKNLLNKSLQVQPTLLATPSSAVSNLEGKLHSKANHSLGGTIEPKKKPKPHKPCIGLCQHYRSLGIPYPYRK